MTWRRLSHKNVVQFLGIATGMGMLPAVILPRFKNGDIVSFIKSHPNCDRLKAIKDIARGLRYLHNFRPAVTHGNLKGSNVLVKEDGTACIVDFGLVFVLDEVDFTVASIAGPVRWMAPEVMMSEGPVYDYCLKADVYAFAMTVIEIISGKLPFTHIHSDSAVILRVIQGERPQYSQGDFVIPGLWQLLEECWKQEADERPNMNGALMHLENL
ncbi:kinase-like protein [Rickenella mellea]|uniref:Kinase-like protein n=1 Tax=Rickenella mellea TaxID=50990 RepID=A0A4Y7Q775_9AGAM|nr:kinase-like protein [Rickenella mellea]